MQNSKSNDWPDFLNSNLKKPNSNSQKTLHLIYHMHKWKLTKFAFRFRHSAVGKQTFSPKKCGISRFQYQDYRKSIIGKLEKSTFRHRTYQKWNFQFSILRSWERRYSWKIDSSKKCISTSQLGNQKSQSRKTDCKTS